MGIIQDTIQQAYNNAGFPDYGKLQPIGNPANLYTPSLSSPWGKNLPNPYANYNPDQGAPTAPNYVPGYDPLSMSTAGDLQKTLDNQPGYNKFSQEAMRTGPSAWAGLATNQQRAEEMNARQQGARDVAGATGGAESALAQRGGITSGARERIQTQGANDLLNMNQNVARQGSQNRLQIGVNDEQNRIEQLGMLPGMEQAKAGMVQNAKQFDIGQEANEATNRNLYLGNIYNQQGKMYGANKTADAQKNSGGSCWLISGLARFFHLPAGEADHLTVFKHFLLEKDPDGAKFYIRRCGKLTERMDERGFDWTGFKWFNDALVRLIQAGELDGAYALFRSTLYFLMRDYWPDCPFKLAEREKEHLASRKARVALIQAPKGEEKYAEHCGKYLRVSPA